MAYISPLGQTPKPLRFTPVTVTASNISGFLGTRGFQWFLAGFKWLQRVFKWFLKWFFVVTGLARMGL